jgi:Short C-terminal domain
VARLRLTGPDAADADCTPPSWQGQDQSGRILIVEAATRRYDDVSGYRVSGVEMKGFHIYTDGWWRNPKHAVTTDATIVEAGPPKRPTGVVTSGPWSPAPSGYFQSVAADVSDPQSGQVVRATGDLYFTAAPFEVGQRIRVRWSAKREAIEAYNSTTAPEDEWQGEASAGGAALAEAIPGAGGTLFSAAELSPDQAARVQQALGALGISGTARVQVMRAQGAGASDGQPDPIEQLEKLAELRKSGALTDEEFEQQKRRVLGEH